MNLLILILLCFSIVNAWDGNIHQRVNNLVKEHPELVHIKPTNNTKSGETSFLTSLRRRPTTTKEVLSCLYKSSQHGLWTPSFRLDQDPLTKADSANRLDMLGWINKEKRQFYIQIPKCASMTIKHYLKGKGFDPVTNWRQLPKGFVLTDYFVFTFVRNPMTRFNAAYGTISSRVKPNQREEMKYDVFVDNLIHNKQEFFSSHHALPQTFFTSDELGLPLTFNFMGKVENFDKDWKELQAHIHLDPPSSYENVREGLPKILEWLEKKATSTQQDAICLYYLSDFLCFDYEIPSYCKRVIENRDTGIELNVKSWSETIYPYLKR